MDPTAQAAQGTWEIQRADERGRTRTGWLDSRHSFSFGGHHDPRRMGFGPLRVLNDDVVAPGEGFGPHPHRDMEIVSYVLEGALRHQDSGGHGGVIRAGEVQFMRAGTGVVHSEMNGSDDAPVRFLQVWILPRRRGLPPAYAERRLDLPEGRWTTVAGGPADEGGFPIDQDATMLAGRFADGQPVRLDAGPGRGLFVFVVEGGLAWEEPLGPRDALLLRGRGLDARAKGASHLLAFDVPL